MEEAATTAPSGCEIGRGRFASWIGEPAKCLRSRKDCADRASLPRAPGASGSPAQDASRGTQHTSRKREARHKSKSRHSRGAEQELARMRNSRTRGIDETNQLLRDKSVSLAESEARGDELRNRLRQQLKATQRLSRLLDEADHAAARLRSSARWQIANPVAALKAKLSPKQARDLLGYGHLEKIISAYKNWRGDHPRLLRLTTKSRP